MGGGFVLPSLFLLKTEGSSSWDPKNYPSPVTEVCVSTGQHHSHPQNFLLAVLNLCWVKPQMLKVTLHNQYQMTIKPASESSPPAMHPYVSSYPRQLALIWLLSTPSFLAKPSLMLWLLILWYMKHLLKRQSRRTTETQQESILAWCAGVNGGQERAHREGHG